MLARHFIRRPTFLLSPPPLYTPVQTSPLTHFPPRKTVTHLHRPFHFPVPLQISIITMSALDSPLDVVALDYLGLRLLTAVVNNVWTWVAVITAAVSVWRKIRSTSSEVCFTKPDVVSVERLAAAKPAETPRAPPPSPSPSISSRVFNSEGRTSGKFTLYYSDDQVEDEEEEEEEAGGKDDNGGLDGNDEGRNCNSLRWNGWEAMMEMRMGDHMGFYRYQDLTVLNGNVVRLWDGCRRRNVVNAAAAASPVVRCGGDGINWQ